jgi:hypothetical protein
MGMAALLCAGGISEITYSVAPDRAGAYIPGAFQSSLMT